VGSANWDRIRPFLEEIWRAREAETAFQSPQASTVASDSEDANSDEAMDEVVMAGSPPGV
jgi:hypothetical protein